MEMDSSGSEDWTVSGHRMWALATADGYVGEAHWREQGAGIAVVRPDGTDLFRKAWGSRAIFLDSWPGMFAWAKGRVVQELAADRAKAAAGSTPPPPTIVDAATTA
jgi:hypothetical protein